MPWGPPFGVAARELVWHTPHSVTLAAYFCNPVGYTLSFTCRDGNSACGEPWQAEQKTLPCPRLKRYRLAPVMGTSLFVANVVSVVWRHWPLASNVDVYR